MKNHFTKPYHTYSVNDFILDDSFFEWVVKRDEASAAFWTQWIQEHPEKKAEIDQARSILKSLSFPNHSLSADEVSSLWVGIKQYKDNTTPQPIPNPHRYLWLKIAASVLIGVAVIYGILRPAQTEWITYNTAFGETKSIVLPDSSTVTLNSNSELRFPGDWDKRPVREVWINGEAFFSVIHKKNHQPFKVHTDDRVAVEVLGTTFNVFHRTKATKVVLNTGKIRLSLANDSRGIMMKPGDMIEYKEESYSRKKVNPAVYSAWTQKRLILDHTSLREIVSMLKDNYGVDVTVATDDLMNQTVSGSMPIGDAAEMVTQIADAFQLKVTKENHSYLMYE